MTPAIPDALREKIDRFQRPALGIGIIGIGLCVLQFFLNRPVFFQSWLFGWLYWNGFVLGSLAILLMHNVVGGNWGVVIKRFTEAAAKTVPITFIGVIPVLLGVHELYIWSHPDVVAHNESIRLKQAYLNVPFWMGRSLLYFVIFAVIAFYLSGLGAEQDRTGSPNVLIRMRRFSAPFLVIFVLSGTFGFFDWIMSIEPDWYSTIYGAMFLVGQVLQTFAFCVILLYLFSNWKPFAGLVKIQHYHDLGNLMLAFTMLWAYTSWSQFLIIWAGNLPDEIPWYLRRFSGGWGAIAFVVAVFHFCVPFFLLLMRFIKKNPKFLATLCGYILLARMLDVYWISIPGLRPRHFVFYWSDIVAVIGIGGIWLWFFLWRLKSRPLLPLRDPRLGYHELDSSVIQDTPGFRNLEYGS